jgi:hypothetical protein
MLALSSSQFDPNVWSGRGVQEVFVDLANAVLHQCIRFPFRDGRLRFEPARLAGYEPARLTGFASKQSRTALWCTLARSAP